MGETKTELNFKLQGNITEINDRKELNSAHGVISYDATIYRVSAMA